jgi:membrane protein DedA with SNARE-associated domain
VPAINISRRLILPGLGVILFLLAYLAQNVWQIFHINDITGAIRNLDQAGIVAGMAILGFVEACVVLCFYVPGTAVLIILLLGMQPGWAQALPLVTGLMVGTVAGYAASLALGKVLQQRLPSLVGEAYFHKMQGWIERYGLAAFVVGAFHPNQLALGFAILGYFRAERVWRYFVVAGAAQLVWWCIYASAADLIASQNLVSSSNFQLYVAAAFSIWLVYELFSWPPRNAPAEPIMSDREQGRAD